MNFTDSAREFFAGDIYATKQCGIVIELAEENHAICSMNIRDYHKNAAGVVMGGAIFTLADFCFAVAANTNKPLTVSLDSHISFLNSAYCASLTAEATPVKDGRNTCTFEVSIKDENKKDIARVITTGYRKQL